MAFIEVRTKGQKDVLRRIDAILKTPSYSIQISNVDTVSRYYRRGKKSNAPRVPKKPEPTVKKVGVLEDKEIRRRAVNKRVEFEKRSAVKNIIILRSQAKAGRNVVYLSAAEKRKLDKYIQDAIHEINKRFNHGKVDKNLDIVGQNMLKIYSGHIKSNQSPKGSLKPNTKNTVDRKVKRQSPGVADWSLKNKLTPLIETGALMKSFTFKVKKRRGKWQ